MVRGEGLRGQLLDMEGTRKSEGNWVTRGLCLRMSGSLAADMLVTGGRSEDGAVEGSTRRYKRFGHVNIWVS